MLAVLCIAQLVVSLDGNVVLIAAPAIQRGLGFAAANLQWLLTGYALTYGSLLLTGGRAGDLLGHRRMFLWSLALFGATSLAGGLAFSQGLLLAARVLQGACAAALAPAALALIATGFPEGPGRTRAFGVFQGLAAGGATAGVLVGGLLTQALGWRAVFLINPPIIAALLLLGRRYLPAALPGRSEPLDLAGSALAASALATFIYALVRAQEHGVGALVLVALGGAMVLAVAFFVVERHEASPMLDLRLLEAPRRRATLLAGLLLGGVLSANAYTLVLYLQHVLGWSPLQTGLAVAPGTVAGIVLSVYLTRPIIGRIGGRASLLAGLACVGLGQFWLSHLADSYLRVILPGYVFTFAGASIARPAISVRVTAGVQSHQQGQAGGLVVAAAQVGSASILALLAIAGAAHGQAMGSQTDGFRFAYVLATGAMVLALAIVAAENLPASRDRTTTTGVPSLRP